MFMDKNIVPLENITALVKPLAEKYHVREIYLIWFICTRRSRWG